MNEDRTDLSPAQWDAALNTDNAPEQWMRAFLPLDSHLRARRFLACAVATRDMPAIAAALQQVEWAYPDEVFGVRLMALGQLGQPEAIAALPATVRVSTDPSDLEDSCDEALARGMAARSLQAYEEAYGHLCVALFLSRALGMRYREQHVMLELGQVLTVQGRPDPEFIEQALAMPINVSTRRREYGAQALAEACLAVGDYRRAWRLVTWPGESQSGLWGFIGALLNETSSRDVPLRDGAYLALTAAVWALRDGEAISMPSLSPHSPEAEYAALIRSVAMLRTPTMVSQAQRSLTLGRPMTPDQRVWQLAGLVHVAALAGTDENTGELMRQFRDALDALRTREYLLPLLREIMPEAFMLLGFLPWAHPDVEDSLSELPILTGEGVTHRFQTHKLPGKAAGSAVWVRAAATGRSLQVHRQARERLRDALVVLGHTRMVNLGVALRALTVLGPRAPGPERARWNIALQQALGWVDSEVLRRDLIREFQGRS